MTMGKTGYFLPFWNLFIALFVWFLMVEGLKKLGLIKSK